MSILLVVLAAIAGYISCYIGCKDAKISIIPAAIGFAFAEVITLWGLPTVGFFYFGVWFIIIIPTIIGGIIGIFMKDNPRGAILPIGLIVLLIGICFISTSAILRSTSYHEVIGKVEKKEFKADIPVVDTKHIRLVSKETALTLARKVLGQADGGTILGSQLEVDSDSMAIQEVDGELWWIIPLDFSGYFKWSSRGTVPGYIRVSAQDPTREAQFIDRDPATGQKFQMKYTRGAFFGSWLDRVVYGKYPTIAREEFTFEVDNNWKPFYTISATYPTIGFSGYQTAGVIIADPQTGEMSLATGKDIPSWVDRVKPLKQALQQISWWGKYKNGWLNAIFSQREVEVPTDYQDGPDAWFVKQGEETFWFTGMTSASSNDQSLVGAMLVNTRTGEAQYYSMQGTDENGVVQTIDASLGADSARWQPSQPIPYNIYGVPTWVLPIVSSEGIYQKVGLVDMNNINTLVIETTLEKALTRYRAVLAGKGNEVAPTSGAEYAALGPEKVLRVGNTVLGGEKTYYLLVAGAESKLFSANGESVNTRLVAMVKPGDLVTLRFLETTESVMSIEGIEIAGVKLRTSPVQAAYNVQREKSRDAENTAKSAHDAEKTWENLSPKEKADLLKQARKR